MSDFNSNESHSAADQPRGRQESSQNSNIQGSNAPYLDRSNFEAGNSGFYQWQENPFRLVEEMLPTEAKRTIRVVYGLVGVVAVVLGAALLFWPGKTLTVFAAVLGIDLIISGLVRLVSAIVEVGLPSGWRVLDILLGILLAVGGVIILKNMAVSALTLVMMVSLMVGIGWIMEGVMSLMESWRMPSSGWSVLYGIISVIAGVIVLFNPFASTTVLIIFSGCSLVVIGISAIIRAFRFGNGSKVRN